MSFMKKAHLVFGLLVVGSLVLAGCTRAVIVRDAVSDSGKVPGVPFYVKRGVYTQATAYRRTFLQVTLQITQTVVPAEGDGPPKTVSSQPQVKRVTNDDDGRKAINALRGEISSSPPNAIEILKSFIELPELVVAMWEWEEKPILNKVTASSEVDYSKVYYLNASAPWFGSGTLSSEIAADGTLSKVDATVEPGIAEDLTSLLPLKEVLEAKHVSVDTGGDDEGESSLVFMSVVPDSAPKAVLSFSVVIEPQGEIATFEKVTFTDPRAGGSLTALLVNFDDGQFNIQPIKSGGATTPKKQDSAWSVSGTLTPPGKPAGKSD